MYYYIFEPPLGAKDYERATQIKEYIASLGIAGEMTTPTPGKGVEALVEMAINKRYSTIIAVGGMVLINQIARALESHDLVFGIIPTVEHSDITRLIGVSNWKSAADQLKRRRFRLVRQGIMNNQIYFLTPATVLIPDKMEFKLSSAAFTLQGMGGLLTIRILHQDDDISNLSLTIDMDRRKNRGILWPIFRNKKNQVGTSSYFNLESFQLETTGAVSVNVSGESLTTTPFTCSTQSKSLKLIVGRSLDGVK